MPLALEHRHLKCPRCIIVIRLTITEKHYGKKVEVTCPGCGQVSRATIPVPSPESTGQKLPGLDADFLKAYRDLFGLDPLGKKKK